MKRSLWAWATFGFSCTALAWACSGDDTVLQIRDGGAADGTVSGDGGATGDDGGGGGDDGSGGDAASQGDGGSDPDKACAAGTSKAQCAACCAQLHPGGAQTLITAESNCACSDTNHCLANNPNEKCGKTTSGCLAQVGQPDAAASCSACFQDMTKADASPNCVQEAVQACAASAACVGFEKCAATAGCSNKP